MNDRHDLLPGERKPSAKQATTIIRIFGAIAAKKLGELT
jgi:hypothetical protein